MTPDEDKGTCSSRSGQASCSAWSGCWPPPHVGRLPPASPPASSSSLGRN